MLCAEDGEARQGTELSVVVRDYLFMPEHSKDTGSQYFKPDAGQLPSAGDLPCCGSDVREDPGLHLRVFSVAGANAQYAGEWILMRVTAFDERHDPFMGEVIAHAPERRQVAGALPPWPPSRETAAAQPGTPYYIFKAKTPAQVQSVNR